MHIGGTPGSGKTYLGKVLKSLHPDIKVIDTDQLKDRFIEKPIPENMEIMEKLTKFKSYGKKSKSQINLEKKYEENYVSYIQNKFKKLHMQKNKYILVGHFFMFDDMIIDIPTKNKVYLDVSKEDLFLRRNGRFIKDIVTNRNYFLGLLDEGEEFWKYNYLWNFTDNNNISKQLEKSKVFYQDHKYKPMDEKKIKELVQKELKK